MAKDATWVEIDPESLPHDVRSFYTAYKALYRQAKEARLQFEAAMAEAGSVDAGQRMIFGYNFGKLSVAIVEDDRKPSKPKARTLTLAEYLRQQSEQGRA